VTSSSRYKSKSKPKPTFPDRVRTPADFAQLIRAMLAPNKAPIPVPLLLALGVDGEHILCGFGVQDDAETVADLRVDKLKALAAELGAVVLVLAHVLPPGSAVPGADAAREFSAIAEACHRADLLLVDCVVVRGGRWWSLRSLAASL